MIIKSMADFAPSLKRLNPLKREPYRSCPPAWSNLSDVVPRWRAEQEPILSREHAVLPEAHIVELADAILFDNGRVCTADGTIMQETLHNGVLDQEPDLSNPQADEGGMVMVLRKPGDSNYGHWLLEICPRVREFQEHYPDNDWRVAIPSGPREMIDVMAQSLAAVGVSRERILHFGGKPTRFKRLSFITSNSVHSHTHDPLGVAFMRERLMPRAPVSADRRLFIARENSIRRRLLNEGEVRPILDAAGFETIYPERLTLEEQIAVFSQAALVVGVSGAALTNLMFAPRTCKTLCLQPNQGHEFFFWDIANIVGQEFSFLFGQATETGKGGHSNFEVDTERVKVWLAERMP